MSRLIAAAILLSATACAPEAPPIVSTQGDEMLAEALAGRTAAGSQACVNVHELRGSSVYPDSRAFLFRGPGNTLYLNRPSGCAELRWGLALSTNTPSGRLCAGEIVQLIDQGSGENFGGCTLNRFVPYR